MIDIADKSGPLSEEEAFTLGVEAYIFGYPLMVMDSLRRVMTNVVAPVGTFAPMGQFAHHRSFPGGSEQGIAGASLDTLYSLAWLDVGSEPYLLRLPDAQDRFFMMPVLDGWTEVIGNPGTRTTQGRAGDYVITGPGWTGELPPGAQHVPSATEMVFIVGRTYCTGTAADYERVHALQDQYLLVPLSQAAEQNPRLGEGVVDPSIDMTTPARDQIDNLGGVDFFRRLAGLLKSNPPTAQDTSAVQALSRLGVLDGDGGQLAPDVANALQRVSEAAHQQILGHYAAQRQANGWMISTGSGHYGTDYLQRALVAYIGVGGNLPEDAFYPIARFDAEGQALSGANDYILRFTTADIPPIDSSGFWSITLYDSGYFLVPNTIDRHSLGSQDALHTNHDGSVDIYVGQNSPGAEKEANWLPAPAAEFILMMRLYSPKNEAIDGIWTPPPVNRLN